MMAKMVLAAYLLVALAFHAAAADPDPVY